MGPRLTTHKTAKSSRRSQLAPRLPPTMKTKNCPIHPIAPRLIPRPIPHLPKIARRGLFSTIPPSDSPERFGRNAPGALWRTTFAAGSDFGVGWLPRHRRRPTPPMKTVRAFRHHPSPGDASGWSGGALFPGPLAKFPSFCPATQSRSTGQIWACGTWRLRPPMARPRSQNFRFHSTINQTAGGAKLAA